MDRWLLMQRLHNDKHNADMLCTEGSGAREQLVASYGQEKVRGCLSPTRTATKRRRRMFNVSSDSMEEKLVQVICEKMSQKINNITCTSSRRCSMYEFLSGTAKIHFFFSNCGSLQSSPSLLDHSFKRPYGPDYLRGTIGNQIWDELWLNPLAGSLIITANSFQQYNSC